MQVWRSNVALSIWMPVIGENLAFIEIFKGVGISGGTRLPRTTRPVSFQYSIMMRDPNCESPIISISHSDRITAFEGNGVDRPRSITSSAVQESVTDDAGQGSPKWVYEIGNGLLRIPACQLKVRRILLG